MRFPHLKTKKHLQIRHYCGKIIGGRGELLKFFQLDSNTVHQRGGLQVEGKISITVPNIIQMMLLTYEYIIQ